MLDTYWTIEVLALGYRQCAWPEAVLSKMKSLQNLPLKPLSKYSDCKFYQHKLFLLSSPFMYSTTYLIFFFSCPNVIFLALVMNPFISLFALTPPIPPPKNPTNQNQKPFYLLNFNSSLHFCLSFCLILIFCFSFYLILLSFSLRFHFCSSFYFSFSLHFFISLCFCFDLGLKILNVMLFWHLKLAILT